MAGSDWLLMDDRIIIIHHFVYTVRYQLGECVVDEILLQKTKKMENAEIESATSCMLSRRSTN